MESASGFDGGAYQARLDAIARTGVDMHGEASLVRSYHPSTVLDAGCGTGRVAIELARHHIDVLGVDVDSSMIAEARRLAPELEWIEADLSTLSLARLFDVVVLAGNVPLFCPESSRSALVKACAAHVAPRGLLITGFQLGRGYHLDDFNAALDDTGMSPEDRWSSWDREVLSDHSDFVVTVDRRV